MKNNQLVQLVSINMQLINLAMLTRELMAYDISPPSKGLIDFKRKEYADRAKELIELMSIDINEAK